MATSYGDIPGVWSKTHKTTYLLPETGNLKFCPVCTCENVPWELHKGSEKQGILVKYRCEDCTSSVYIMTKFPYMLQSKLISVVKYLSVGTCAKEEEREFMERYEDNKGEPYWRDYKHYNSDCKEGTLTAGAEAPTSSSSKQKKRNRDEDNGTIDVTRPKKARTNEDELNARLLALELKLTKVLEIVEGAATLKSSETLGEDDVVEVQNSEDLSHYLKEIEGDDRTPPCSQPAFDLSERFLEELELQPPMPISKRKRKKDAEVPPPSPPKKPKLPPRPKTMRV